MHIVGMANIHLDSDVEAVDWLRRSIETNRNFPPSYFWLAAALGLLGALDDARTAAKPDLRSIQALPSAACLSANQATIRFFSRDVSGSARACA
jgi:hypothetical protein